MYNYQKLRLEALESAITYLDNLTWDKTIQEYLKKIFPEYDNNIVIESEVYIEYSDHILLDIFLYPKDELERMFKIGQLELREIIENDKIISIIPIMKLFIIPIILNLNIEIEEIQANTSDSKNNNIIDLSSKYRYN